MFQTIAIIGLGLIGSSLAYDIRSHKLATRLIGIDTDPEAEQALSQVLDEFAAAPGKNLKHADLVILAVPPGQFEATAKAIAPHLMAGAILCDVGSVKQYAVDTIAPHLPENVTFLPCHPIAGSERSGPASGKAGLFLHRRVIITPYRIDSEEAARKIVPFWQAVGAVCELLPPEQHDLIYAHISHAPQIIAYAAMLTMAPHRPGHNPETDIFLRLAGSNPALWRDIVFANKKHVANALESILHVATQLRQELGTGIDQGISSTVSPEGVTLLFPRMIASALIHAVSFCERTYDVSLARYAGPGFIDLTSIVQAPPEQDIEKIAHSYNQLYELLHVFEQHLDQFLRAIRQEDWAGFEKKCQEAEKAHREWAS